MMMLLNILIFDVESDETTALSVDVEQQQRDVPLYSLIQQVLLNSSRPNISAAAKSCQAYLIVDGVRSELDLSKNLTENGLAHNGNLEIVINSNSIHQPQRSNTLNQPQINHAKNSNSKNIENEHDQQQILEQIQANNIQMSLQNAAELMPESFIPVNLLHIECTVKDYVVAALVDTGAQTTIVGRSFAEKAGLMRLVDKNFKGMALGVGTQEIIGRIHILPVTFAGCEIDLSVSVIDIGEISMLIGLNMLLKYSALIDLKQHCVIFDGLKVPFMSESRVEVLKQGVKRRHLDAVKPLTDQGFTLKESLSTYEACNEDVDAACAVLLNN